MWARFRCERLGIGLTPGWWPSTANHTKPAQGRIGRVVLEQPELRQLYGGWLASLHATAWKEIEAMARTMGKRLNFDIRPAVESLGLDRVIEQVGIDRVIQQVGEKEVVRRIGLECWLANLSPAERRELKRRLR